VGCFQEEGPTLEKAGYGIEEDFRKRERGVKSGVPLALDGGGEEERARREGVS